MFDTNIRDDSLSPSSDDIGISVAMIENESKKIEMQTKKSKYRPSYFTPKIKFSPDEDNLLIEAVKILGTNVWHDIALKVPGRNARQCRERWNNYLNPSLISAPWTPEEDLFLLQKRKDLGLNWQNISVFFPQRSKNSIKNRYSILIRRQTKKDRKFHTNKSSKNINSSSQKSLQKSDKPLVTDSKNISDSVKVPAIFNLDEEMIDIDSFSFIIDRKNPTSNGQQIKIDENSGNATFSSLFDNYGNF